VALLAQLGISDIAHHRVGELAYGKQRLLEIAVAQQEPINHRE
jgi:ABC-type branched-subunit amino acid transport system ATPase component